jgi:TFIIF-interacting CTD phosphatase-like protein
MPKQSTTLKRRAVVRWESYGVNKRLATLACRHQKIIEARGPKRKYQKSAPCLICTIRPKGKRSISDAAALKEIYDLMEAHHEWDSDTTDQISAIIMKTGRGFSDPNTSNDDEGSA